MKHEQTQATSPGLVKKLEPMQLPPLPQNPLVSVLIPNYNYGQYISDAIESVLNQTYQNFEIVICDDGSTDNSLEAIRRYAEQDNRITYIAKPNGGVASALNVAFNSSTGHILCFLDADDFFASDKLEKIVNVFKSHSHPGYVTHRMRIVYGAAQLGEVIPIFTPMESGYLGPKLYRRGGRWRYMPASAICLRREVADLLFPIDEALFRSVADAYLFTLAPILTTVEIVDEVLSFYRLHGSNLTGQVETSVKGVEKTLSDLERSIEGVNRRLKDLGLPELDVSLNINYLEQKLFLSLAKENNRFEQWENLIKVTRAMLNDDLFTGVQRTVGLCAYWTSLILPRPLRLRYLRMFTHPSRLKYLLWRILRPRSRW